MVMKIYDVTHPISASMLSFPGVSAPSFVQEDRGLYLISDLHLSSHCGTHIDAPVHYLKHGATIDQMPLEPVVGPCQVIDLSANGSEIRRSDLQEKIGDQELILLKTAFSKAAEFYTEFPHLSREQQSFLLNVIHHAWGSTAPPSKFSSVMDRFIGYCLETTA
jgi:arylformamidase